MKESYEPTRAPPASVNANGLCLWRVVTPLREFSLRHSMNMCVAGRTSGSR